MNEVHAEISPSLSVLSRPCPGGRSPSVQSAELSAAAPCYLILALSLLGRKARLFPTLWGHVVPGMNWIQMPLPPGKRHLSLSLSSLSPPHAFWHTRKITLPSRHDNTISIFTWLFYIYCPSSIPGPLSSSATCMFTHPGPRAGRVAPAVMSGTDCPGSRRPVYSNTTLHARLWVISLSPKKRVSFISTL